MDAESLTAIVELQRAIATGEADMDQAMDLIAAGARNVANATGIAIGLLQGDQLVYRAGSGSGVTYVGQHVMATLCVSGHNKASGEILRVLVDVRKLMPVTELEDNRADYRESITGVGHVQIADEYIEVLGGDKF